MPEVRGDNDVTGTRGPLHRLFLERLAARDWDGLLEVLADDFEWHGPQGDQTHRSADYVDRLRGSVGRLENYRLEVVREAREGALAMVELVQRFAVGGEPTVVPEVMVFDTDPRTGRVRGLAVYLRGADKP